MSEERGKKERQREREVETGMGSRGQERGAEEGEMIARNSSPGRCGVEWII